MSFWHSNTALFMPPKMRLDLPPYKTMKTITQLVKDLASKGGAIVSTNDCSEIEITDAQSTNRFARASSLGFVRRTKEWLELQKSRELAKGHIRTDLMRHGLHVRSAPKLGNRQ